MKNFICYIFISTLLFGLPLNASASLEKAVFAGGCFWCLEHDLEVIPGVISAESGYTGGNALRPNYQDHNGHQEAVRVEFDSSKLAFTSLLRSYWRNIDPFDGQGQFCDRGDSYRPVIFYIGDSQREEIEGSIYSVARELNEQVDSLKVSVQPLKEFWIAEDYHQDFAEKNNLKYTFYRYNCGRDRRLENIWAENAKTSNPWKK